MYKSLVALGVTKGEAGGYVLQLGAASHCGVGIPTAQLHIILQLGVAYHCGAGIPTAQLHFAAGCGVSLWSW